MAENFNHWQSLASYWQREVEHLQSQLVESMRRLATEMESEARNIEAGYTVNELGVVQGRGLDIDRLCAKLVQARAVVNSVQHSMDAHNADAKSQAVEAPVVLNPQPLVPCANTFGGDCATCDAEDPDCPACDHDACPGCGCEPGDGITASCNHPDGCGYWKQWADEYAEGDNLDLSDASGARPK